MPYFKKKPVIIEAVQWNGHNDEEIEAFVKGPIEIVEPDVFIQTLEGRMMGSPSDWIIKGMNGEFYPCKPDIFEKTYELVEELS